MTARIRNKPDYWHTPVDQMPVQPHRYLYNDFDDSYQWKSGIDYKAWKAAVPYQPGQVVWCKRWSNAANTYVACKALILDIFVDADYRERHGDRREKYRITYATAGGKWSANFTYTFPGFVQEGYRLAGEAPDLPTKEK